MNAPEHTPHAPSANDPQQPKPGRDARGRFAKGNLGGPGNPFARKVAALRTALIETVTEDDMRCIAEQLVVVARLGDLAAIKLLFQYVLGKPAAAVDLDTLDVEEVALYRRSPTAQEVHEAATERLPADAVAEVLRIERPCLGAGFQDAVARGVFGIGPDDEVDEKEFEQQQAAAAPSPDGGVADDPRRTMTGPSASGGRHWVEEALALLKELQRRAEAARLDGDWGARPLGNGGNGEGESGHRALEWLRRARGG